MDDEQEDSFESDDSTDPTQVITPPATPAPRNIIYTDYHPKNIAATTTKPEVKKEGFFGKQTNHYSLHNNAYSLWLWQCDY